MQIYSSIFSFISQLSNRFHPFPSVFSISIHYDSSRMVSLVPSSVTKISNDFSRTFSPQVSDKNCRPLLPPSTVVHEVNQPYHFDIRNGTGKECNAVSDAPSGRSLSGDGVAKKSNKQRSPWESCIETPTVHLDDATGQSSQSEKFSRF